MNDNNPLGVPAHRHWPDQRDPVLAAELNEQRRQSYNAETLRTRARGEGTRRRPAAITDEMLRAAETHHGDSCSYCTSAGDIDCPTAAILDALASSPAPGDSP